MYDKAKLSEYKFRVIVPSYNRYGDLQFFIARSYVNTKLKLFLLTLSNLAENLIERYK